MRGKRAKQYRKLMQQYGLNFGFREPYQVLLDADIIRDAEKFKMDLIGGLERTLCGKIKPMITQCSMRHLYSSDSETGKSRIIDKAKLFERRRCGHIPSDYPLPLNSQLCIASVVDPKSSGHNKHRYIVASQNIDVRKAMRDLMGVPIIYINRGVIIMEPMTGKTVENREKEELNKLRAGVKRGIVNPKRKRNDVDLVTKNERSSENDIVSKKKFSQGPKGPNPLAVKKPKKKSVKIMAKELREPSVNIEIRRVSMEGPDKITKKRKRKHKSSESFGGGTVDVTSDVKHNC